MSTALTLSQKVKTLAEMIAARRQSFAEVATAYLPPDRLVKLAQAMLSRNPGLADCTPLSVLTELMKCSRLGLEPNEPGGIWLVPFKNKDKGITECQGITDYRGLIDVARRSGQIAAVHADVRREADEWEYWIQTDSPVLVHLKHVPAERDRGQVIGAYAVARLQNGQCHAASLSKEEVEGFRERSRAKNAPAWTKDWNAMACKTACRRMVNLLPRTPEVQALREALSEEDAIEAGTSVIPEIMDVPSEPTQTEKVKQKLTNGTKNERRPTGKDAPEQDTSETDDADVPGFPLSEDEEPREPGEEG